MNKVNHVYAEEIKCYIDVIKKLHSECVETAIEVTNKMPVNPFLKFLQTEWELFMYEKCLQKTFSWIKQQGGENQGEVVFELNNQRKMFVDIYDQASIVIPGLSQKTCCAKCLVEKVKKSLYKNPEKNKKR